MTAEASNTAIVEHAVKKIRVDEPKEQEPRKGIAPVKKEYLVEDSSRSVSLDNDDEAERSGLRERGTNAVGGGMRNKSRGQNKNRKFQQPRDAVKFCERAKEGADCEFGPNCRYEHDVSKYIDSKPKDLEGVCPVFEAIGYCPSGIKCRWLLSHFKDNSLVVNQQLSEQATKQNYEVHRVPAKIQNDLQRKKYTFERSESYIKYMEQSKAKEAADKDERKLDEEDQKASYVEAQFKVQEKKRLYLSRAKILSPLTTVGNLPYRRLMKELGADVTYSEMALCLPLIQGSKSEWALARAHSSEVGGFGVQVATSKEWQAIKAAEAIAEFAPQSSEINLNCGCPIDLLYRQGAGSALLDNPARILRMIRGMAAVSGDIPVTIKMRTGTRDGHNTAKNLVNRLMNEAPVSAITLHGRSRAQRYTKFANWDYIRETAECIKQQREDKDLKPWIIGNGDIYSWHDWHDKVDNYGVDSVMVARGALIKPWIFQEIDAKQYLDIPATERLDIIKKYAYYGLEHWGSDEYGISQTRRFLCEFLSFTHRYVPVGILEYLPPHINDRPPLWTGRNELETLLGSGDYKDWIKISEMFLGPVHEDFEFTPKHKSNAY